MINYLKIQVVAINIYMDAVTVLKLVSEKLTGKEYKY